MGRRPVASIRHRGLDDGLPFALLVVTFVGCAVTPSLRSGSNQLADAYQGSRVALQRPERTLTLQGERAAQAAVARVGTLTYYRRSLCWPFAVTVG
jgi:hypothetical protein